MGRAWAGDPDSGEGIFEGRIGAGDVDVMLGHALRDLAKVLLNVGEGGAVSEQIGRQRVTGLVRDCDTDVKVVDPSAEVVVEPTGADRVEQVAVAGPARE